MPASKVRAIIEKELGGRKLTYEHVLYLKRYFGVSSAAMLRRVRGLGYLSAAQHEAWLKLHPETRENAPCATQEKNVTMGLDETKEALPRDETLWMASYRDCILLIA